MKHNLTPHGLSLSQAQSISNLCYQRAMEITSNLSGINNATRSITVKGDTYIETPGKKVPATLVELLLEKAKLHAAQAFLMSNIKMKEIILNEIQTKRFVTTLEPPAQPNYVIFKHTRPVDEEFGWESLTSDEFAEYLEAEAYAAHIGQFIHKNGTLDNLRKELATLKTLDWMEVDKGTQTPVVITAHHTPDELLTYHEKLATLHRGYEQRVNFYKAKVKNLTTEENARIARENADKSGNVNKENEILRLSYQNAFAEFQGLFQKENEEFEAKRQDEIKAAAALRISIDPRFQETIDVFLNLLTKED